MTNVIDRSKLADFLSATVPQFSGDFDRAVQCARRDLNAGPELMIRAPPRAGNHSGSCCSHDSLFGSGHRA
jgi:hypothetical protein